MCSISIILLHKIFQISQNLINIKINKMRIKIKRNLQPQENTRISKLKFVHQNKE